MLRKEFAALRERDSRGRFVKMLRPDSDMLFDRQQDSIRPMAVICTGKGLKGLFKRLAAALIILKTGRIPVIMVEKPRFPKGILRELITSDHLGQSDRQRDEKYET